MLKTVSPSAISDFVVPGLVYGALYSNASASPVAAGSGYAANDTVTLTGGTFTTAAVISVDAVSTGAITAYHLVTPGRYTAIPGSPVTMAQGSTSGSGTGATFSITFGVLASEIDYAAFVPGGINGETILGYHAGLGRKLGGGIGNTYVGFGTGGAGLQNGDGFGGGTGATTALEDTCVGNYAGTQITTGGFNTFLGHNAGGHETTGARATYVGTDSGKWAYLINDSTAVGANSLKFVANGSSNTAIGSSAFIGAANITSAVSGAANNGSNLIRLTVGSTTNMATGDLAVVTGVVGTTEANAVWTITVIDGTHVDLQGSTFTNTYTSGGSLSDFPTNAAARNTVIGSGAVNGSATRGIVRNVVIGDTTAQALTSAADTVIIGSTMASALTSGGQNVFIGGSAATTPTTAAGNVIIGYKANSTAATGINHTVIIGGNANGGGAGARGGSQSVVIGGQAGNASLTGANNVVLGFQVGSTTLTTGTNNVLIGTSSSIDTAANGTANTIAIGAGSTAVISATGCGTPSTSTATIAGLLTVTGAATPTGGIAAAGGFSVSPRLCHTGAFAGNPATSAFTAQTPVTTEFYFAEVFIPANCTVTGVGVFNSATISGNMKVGLSDSAGNIVATSVSTAMAGTSTFQRVAFTGTYAAKGPATYFVCVFYDNATVRPNTHTVGNFGAGKSTSQVFSTGFTTITPPTTFTTALGPVGTLY